MITHTELKRIFELIEDKNHWKNPIAKTIDLNTKEFDGVSLEAITDAIEFFTATLPTFTALGHREYRVAAIGYTNGPAN